MITIRIATRQSALALWQAEAVARALTSINPELKTELIKITTQGDKILDSPLSKIGGKGLFVKELEQSLLSATADIAVHSMKDVPMDLPPGLQLPVILKREDPADAFVSNHYDSLDAMPAGSIVGTSSLRRQAQIRAHFPHLKITSLRGNVGTRLNKLDAENYDAIILAAAGLKRLKLEDRIRMRLAYEHCLPAIGQGAIGIECREGDTELEAIIATLHHSATASCVLAERALNKRLYGGCQVPIAGFARLENHGELWLRGLVGDPGGERLIAGEIRGAEQEAEMLGTTLAEDLLQQGAGEILQAIGLQTG